MPRLLAKSIHLPKPPQEGDQEGIIKYLFKLNSSLVRALDEVYINFNYISEVGNWEDADDTAWGAFGLVPLASAPTGFDGMMAVCDGTSWDLAGDGEEHLCIYLDGWTWVNEYPRASYTANGVTLGDGPPTSGDVVADLQTAFDGNLYTVDEASANAGQNLIIDFTGVTSFSWVQVLGYYDGQATHELLMQLEITPFDDSAWHTYGALYPAGDHIENLSFNVPDSSAYINSGVVKVRFLHPASGNSSDDWVFDCVKLHK